LEIKPNGLLPGEIFLTNQWYCNQTVGEINNCFFDKDCEKKPAYNFQISRAM